MKGPEPRHRVFPSVEAERDGVVRYLRELVPNGFSPSEILVMARTNKLLESRAVPAIQEAGFVAVDLSQRNPDPPRGGVSYCTMHRGKGLQYRAIILMGVDHDHLPLKSVMKRRPDETARRRMQELDRNLLYVAMSRARERLFVTGAVQASPFIPVAPAAGDGADAAS
jgi:superfamily I DNA/RNA helicase